MEAIRKSAAIAAEEAAAVELIDFCPNGRCRKRCTMGRVMELVRIHFRK
jgi:hypothetical protein